MVAPFCFGGALPLQKNGAVVAPFFFEGKGRAYQKTDFLVVSNGFAPGFISPFLPPADRTQEKRGTSDP